jgi:hypothetical protein
VGSVPLGEGKRWEKGEERVNMVLILCTHACKWKNENCCNYSRNGGGRMKENGGGGEFNYNIFDTLQELL